MPITLEEARTLDAFARQGSIASAAQLLQKANSAVVYSLQAIEEKTGLKILDRSGYRTVLLPAGERLLEGCRRLLGAEAEVRNLCAELAQGWEAELRMVVEGLVPLDPIFRALKKTTQAGSTHIHVQVEFLDEVENSFLKTDSDFMISVLPPEKTALESIALAPLPALLVVHHTHPLAHAAKIDRDELKRHTMLRVRGSDPRFNLSTASIECDSILQLNDFHSKKAALMSGIGFGWLPRYMIENELKSKKVKPVLWSGSHTHTFRPYLYHRGKPRLGRAATVFIEELLVENKRSS